MDRKINNTADNNKFLQIVKLLFSNKRNKDTINIMDNGVTISYEKEFAEIFNKYFCNIPKNLSLAESPSSKEPSVELFTNPIKVILKKYKDYRRIASINNKMASMNNPKFSFGFVSLNETL